MSPQTVRSPCHYLPIPDRPLTGVSILELGKERGEPFYLLALQCAQALWLGGLPAQALLLLNRAFSADLTGEEEAVHQWPPPYEAMAWIMGHRPNAEFIGNPRRHFQHLATRMVEPRKELRTWRAWACWQLSRLIFPELSADEKQLREEEIREPTSEEIALHLERLGVPGEVAVWQKACGLAGGFSFASAPAASHDGAAL